MQQHHPAGDLPLLSHCYHPEKTSVEVSGLRQMMRADAAAAVTACEQEFHGVIGAVSEQLISSGTQIILLTGPSASGKTTTAKLLEQELARRGQQVYRISLDNFYRPRAELPRWSDGFLNYESIEGLDLPYFRDRIDTLKSQGAAAFPVFDFHTASRSQKQFTVSMGEHTQIIFEGIHALNPLLTEPFEHLSTLRLYVSIHVNFTDAGQVVLPARELRLIRRILRDRVRRNATPLETLSMWDYVIRGEEEYLHPFRPLLDLHLNTTHRYEPSVYRNAFVREIAPYRNDPTYGAVLRSLEEHLLSFAPADPSLIPPDSLLREFLTPSHDV